MANEISRSDWEVWSSNPITKAYFKELQNQVKEEGDYLLKISSERELARNFFERKGTVNGLLIAIDYIREILANDT